MGGRRGRFGGTGNGMSREVKGEITRQLARGEMQCEIAPRWGEPDDDLSLRDQRQSPMLSRHISSHCVMA